ncbi:hypothetical protein GCM10010357_33550 [Streptomyces luteireticuli]|uniref:Secreted protein n=1 Tax=Streptomyces luteireticuli TaxID=173858 RepID=A0ABN0YTL7_9ACTN
MRRVTRRAMAVAGIVLAAGALQLTTTTSAQAADADSPYKCRTFLKSRGYTVGPKVSRACQEIITHGSDPVGWAVGLQTCMVSLKNIGVRPADAADACSW